MKRTLSIVLCVALIVCMVLTMAGCGVAGRYVLVELSYSGVSVSAEDAGMDADNSYVELESDGTAVLCLDGDKTDMLWDDDQIWAAGKEDSKAALTVDDGVLTIEVDGIEMVFEKE